LIEAWTKAGQSAEHDVDVAEFLKKGLPPGESKIVKIDRHAAGGDAEGSANAAREEELEGMMGQDEYWADNGKGETHADELLALKREIAKKAAPAKKKASPLARQVGVPSTGTKSIKKKFGIDSPGTQPPSQLMTSRNPPN
jgi:hypothetical protein